MADRAPNDAEWHVASHEFSDAIFTRCPAAKLHELYRFSLIGYYAYAMLHLRHESACTCQTSQGISPGGQSS